MSTFYDIHMHAFNLSHPYFLAFVNRFKPKLAPLLISFGVASLLSAIRPIRKLVLPALQKKGRAMKNLLSVMENDVGSFFLLMEDDLRSETNQLLQSDGLHIGEKTYEKIVLTPLMIDFGYKGIENQSIHYSKPSAKPIVEQVIDVFNAIKQYADPQRVESSMVRFPFIDSTRERPFEIYPFLGLNPENYAESDKLQIMLEKYFRDYSGSRDEFRRNLGVFSGDIDLLGCHYFAGIKLYPPLGFDPWPEKSASGSRDRVELLYEYCVDKGIPITVHGSRGGFVAEADRGRLKDFTAVEKWEKVIDRFPCLKLNLAHFPMQEKFWLAVPNPLHPRRNRMIDLVLQSENVYVDFSCRATNERYYELLQGVLGSLPHADGKKLRERILFGTDFTVCLMEVDSYNRYLDLFSRTPALTATEKHAFCSLNPDRFLFG